MQAASSALRYLSVIALAVALLFLAQIVSSWSGPTANPPENNVDAPLNVGPVDQIKDAALGVNALAVFGNALLQHDAYLNWGTEAGESGYGIRDNAGTLEFKNQGAAWESLQSLIFAYCGEGGCGGAGGASLGEWESKSANTVYQASTDGILIASYAASDSQFFLNVLTGSSNPPTTYRGRSACVTEAGSWQSTCNITVPVRSGEYYKVTTQNSGTKLALYWVPLIGGGDETSYTLGGWYVTSSQYCPSIPNPLTGGQSCPSGYTARVLVTALCNASDPSARAVYLCVK